MNCKRYNYAFPVTIIAPSKDFRTSKTGDGNNVIRPWNLNELKFMPKDCDFTYYFNSIWPAGDVKLPIKKEYASEVKSLIEYSREMKDLLKYYN